MKRVLSFVLLIVAIFTITNFVSTAIGNYTANKTISAKTNMSGSLYQLLDTLKNNPELAISLKGKYIETDGALLTMGPEHGGGSYIDFTAYHQTDSSFDIAYTLDYETILQKQNWSACDSAIVDYHKKFKLREMPEKITAFVSVAGSLTEEQESVTYCKFCKPYTVTTTKKRNYLLQNFCYEKVKIKARVHHITKEDWGYNVVLENGVLLSKTHVDKK